MTENIAKTEKENEESLGHIFIPIEENNDKARSYIFLDILQYLIKFLLLTSSQQEEEISEGINHHPVELCLDVVDIILSIQQKQLPQDIKNKIELIIATKLSEQHPLYKESNIPISERTEEFRNSSHSKTKSIEQQVFLNFNEAVGIKIPLVKETYEVLYTLNKEYAKYVGFLV